MRLVDLDDENHCYIGNDGEYEKWNIDNKSNIITCDECAVIKRSECLWHNNGATYCSFAERCINEAN